MDYYLGRRHDINLQRDSLRIRLHENNTVDISARLDVAVHARTWIWKGVNFGFLGCMKITSCGGQTVTYRGKIDMKMSFQVVLLNDPSVPQPVVQSRRRPLLGPSPG